MDTVIAIAAVAVAAAAVVMAVAARRLVTLVGAIESHTTLGLRLRAREAGVEVVWWDPTRERVPTQRAHGDAATVERIYLYVPQRERVGRRKV